MSYLLSSSWLIGWFYMSNLFGLFYTEVSLTNMVSNYILFKNIPLQSS